MTSNPTDEKIMSYRLLGTGIAPRRVKLAIPGWAGTRDTQTNGSTPQPWHCIPFVEGAGYGYEVYYPYATECRVRFESEGVVIDGDFAGESVDGAFWPPFLSTNPGHYSFGALVDIAVPDGWVSRIEPHPRYFTDFSGTVPGAVIANLQTAWWPMFMFLTFKAPLPGYEHIFRRGDAVAQVIAVPKAGVAMEEMSRAAAQDRETFAQLLMRHRDTFTTRHWHSSNGLQFDDMYRQLARLERAQGLEWLRQHVLDRTSTLE